MPSPSNVSTEFTGVTSRPAEAAVDLLFVPVFDGEDHGGDLAGLDEAVGGEWRQALASGEFRRKLYSIFVARVSQPGWQARQLAFVGAGDRQDADSQRLRRLAAACSHAARDRAARSIGWLVRAGGDVPLWASAAADGLSAAEFLSAAYKRDAEMPRFPDRCVVVAPGADGQTLEGAVRRGRVIGAAAHFARALANEPGNVLTPGEFASRVSTALGEVGLRVEILDERALASLGLRLLLGVSRGSAEPPRVIVIRHDPPGAPESPLLAFVGKGVTFDSGGISIKPADGMDRMKDDMAGGAAVAAALRALAELGGSCRVLGIIPTTENMPGGRAMRPGDVITGASGKTVEIINTDAEGRLILADALWYAGHQGATHLVDVATLTGACVVALGRSVSGLFGAPPAWVDAVRSAAERGGDRVWPMPIHEEAREELRSEIADLVNSAGRAGGAITAAAFLREFAEGRPWAHLDIAGTAWAEDRKAYQPKGATGVSVRLLIELAMSAGRWDRESAG